MEWLAQNWIWIALAVGAFFLMSRMGGMGGCGMGHSSGHGHAGNTNGPPGQFGPTGSAFDVVSQRTLSADARYSTVYRGQPYYFETRQNRDAFETDPERYLAGDKPREPTGGRPHRRHGC